MTSAVRILCVDDHDVVREGIAAILRRCDDLELVSSVSCGEDAIADFRALRPDLCLVDLQMPGMTGFDVIRGVRAIDPDARIIVLTMYHGEEDMKRALAAGATAYLEKDTLAIRLVRTIREVAAGPAAGQPAAARSAVRSALTPREEEVVQLISRGMSNKEIGASLGISEGTVDAHVKRIFTKLHVRDRTAAVTAAIKQGSIHVD